MLLEYKVNKQDWPYLLPLVHASIKHTKVASLANRAPVELFTGLESTSPLNAIVRSNAEAELIAVSEIEPDVEAQLKKLRESLREMYLAARVAKEKRARYHKNRDRGKSANFSVGDFVQRSCMDERKGPGKLAVTWVGPFKVIGTHEYFYEIEHLIMRENGKVHAPRLKFYNDDSLNGTKELLEHVAAQDQLLGVEAIRSHRYNP